MALEHYTKSALRQAARGELAKGVFWLIAAATVSVATYLLADVNGRYYVFWGALAYGAYRLVRGLYFFIYPEALLKR